MSFDINSHFGDGTKDLFGIMFKSGLGEKLIFVGPFIEDDYSNAAGTLAAYKYWFIEISSISEAVLLDENDICDLLNKIKSHHPIFYSNCFSIIDEEKVEEMFIKQYPE